MSHNNMIKSIIEPSLGLNILKCEFIYDIVNNLNNH